MRTDWRQRVAALAIVSNDEQASWRGSASFAHHHKKRRHEAGVE
jgi:hypothetical protein